MRTLEVRGLEVLSKETVRTARQLAVVYRHHCMLSSLSMVVDKQEIQADGVDQCQVTIAWERFDLEHQAYAPDAKQDLVLVDVAGQTAELTPDETGVVSFTFASQDPGEHLIRTINEGAANAELKVVAVNV